MELKMTATFVCVILLVYAVFVPTVNGYVTEQTCQLTLYECNYTMTFLPSDDCYQGNHGEGHQGHKIKHSRSKRSTTDDTEHYELAKILLRMDSVSHKFERLEQKLVREMRDLSKRVLRGARKMESLLNNPGDRRSKVKRSRSCPEGFESVDNWPSCYMFSRFNATWFNAIDYCTALESELVALEEVKEHFLVTFLISNNPVLSQAAGWWTSGSFITKSKQWVWKTTHQSLPFSYIKWATNEPNEEHDQNLMGVMMYRLDGYLWHDQIYTDKYNFVCEKVMA